MAPPSKKRPSTDELLRRWEADKKSRIFLQLAEEYRKQDFVDAAVSVLREGLKTHPNFQPAHVALARCFMAKRQWTEAQAELERVHLKSPDNLLAGKLLVEVLEGRGEKSEALAVAKRLVPFAAFDDPEVEATAKRLESELAAPNVKPAGSSSTTGTGDTMDFGGDSTQDVAPAGAPGPTEDVPILVDADAFAEDGPAEGPPTSPDPPSATEPGPPLVDAEPDWDATHDELDAESTHEDMAAMGIASPPPLPVPGEELDAESTHDELGAVGRAPFGAAPPPLPGGEEDSPDDLLGRPEAAVATASSSGSDENDLTSLTLAELYEAQDSPHEAAAIYEKLLERRVGDGDLLAALERCRARIEGRSAESAPAPEVVESSPEPSSVELPKWEPAPPTAATTAIIPETTPDISTETLEALLSEYGRWLAAVRAVRQ